MPIVSKTTQGEKTIVNVVFVAGENGADECYEECLSRFGVKQSSEAKKPAIKKRPVKKAKGV